VVGQVARESILVTRQSVGGRLWVRTAVAVNFLHFLDFESFGGERKALEVRTL
jgi:hypothetical protein